MFKLTIVTAEKTVYEGNIKMLVAPAVEGEIGILTNHQPIVTKLGAGGMRLVKEDDTEEVLFTAGGFLEFLNNEATRLADLVEDIKAIEVEQARAARFKAEGLLRHAQEDVDRDKLEEEIRMHMIRERLAEVGKFKKHKS